MKHIAIITPCYNEADNILPLYEALCKVTQALPYRFSYVFVDDGSTDSTLAEIESLAQSHSNVRYISFTRNFGQDNALLAGIRSVNSDAIIILDCDLQHPVSLLPQMISQWEEGYAVVSTKREKSPHAHWLKSVSSQVFYSIFQHLTQLKIDYGSTNFKLIDDKVATLIRPSRERNIFLRGLIEWYGFPTATITYTANPRLHGETKYTFRKMCMLALSGITSFSIKPLRLAFLIALPLLIASALCIGWGIYDACHSQRVSSEWLSIVTLLLFVSAWLFLLLGLMGEYLGKCLQQSNGRPDYIINKQNL